MIRVEASCETYIAFSYFPVACVLRRGFNKSFSLQLSYALLPMACNGATERSRPVMALRDPTFIRRSPLYFVMIILSQKFEANRPII